MRPVHRSALILRFFVCLLTGLVILSCNHKKGTEPPPTPPDPPTNVTATSISPFAMQLSWQNHGDYDSVLVDRMATGREWLTLDTLPGNATNYLDTTCVPADSYYYRIGGLVGSLLSWSLDSAYSNTPAVLAPAELQVIGRTGVSISLQWQDRSSNETGFNIFGKSTGDWTLRETAQADQDTVTVQGLLPLTAYSFRVTAYSRSGESEPSNQVDTTTREIYLPTAPGNVIAEALTPLVVRLGWEDRGDCLNFIVSRKISTSWMMVRFVPDGTTQYLDSTAQPATSYWYKIGAQGDEGVAWSADSSHVFTPHFPVRPDSLRFTIQMGTGVLLSWIDRSDNETHFEIEREISGGQFARLDSLAADQTTYTDLLADNIGHYYYRIRSVNQFGSSNWLVSAEVDYRFCSDGIIPVCIGNFWQYRMVTGSDTSYSRLEVVPPVTYVNSLDYYLLTEARVPGGVPDSLYYVRNNNDQGFSTVPYPLPSAPVGQIVYQYPAFLGDRYPVDHDTMIVTSESTTQLINGVFYTGLISYNRLTATNSYIIWIKPETVGIVRIFTYNRSGTVLQSQRDLMLYSVSNFTKK